MPLPIQVPPQIDPPPPYPARYHRAEGEHEHLRVFRGTFTIGNRELETSGTYDSRHSAVFSFEDHPARRPSDAPNANANANATATARIHPTVRADCPNLVRPGLSPIQRVRTPERLDGARQQWLEDRLSMEQRLRVEKENNQKLREWIIKERREMRKEVQDRVHELRMAEGVKNENASLKEEIEQLKRRLARCEVDEQTDDED
ncbi:predicted protein [Uncinocarpus reesii 1704]|uniref:Uncharacterized protein n=1 Tax=Uncinocarpus reesii (strain UAMH 1704) TaxID=336963 RepID=C4JGZ0_UNCRE|nr:uncharacterized protein UREG_01241 [Uncinocarpus reesii 1704]EEP76392.1 predicted protein [Uncinocarpus reesii 1704]